MGKRIAPSVNIVVTTLLLFAVSSINADDTDIYLYASSSGSAPYVMFTLDYRQDLSGPYCKDKGNASEQCFNLLNTPATFRFLQSLDALINGVPSGASDGDSDGDGLRDSASDMSSFEASKMQALVAVVRAVFQDLSGVNVGLMISNNDSGGTILRGYKEFLVDDSNNAKQELIDILLSLPMPKQGNAFHESQPKELHYEWFSYINGGGVIYGNQTANNFDGTNTPAPDPNVFNGSFYNSPFTSSPSNFECTNFYEIYATSGNETGTDNDLNSLITSFMNSSAAAKFEDMVDYMTNNDLLLNTNGDQTLKTWFIQIGNSAAHADEWADAAGTRDQYMVISGNGNDLINIETVMKSVFTQATTKSATFVAPTVPTNVFNRAKAFDSMFMALFEPQTTERWAGNIKKFKFKDSDSDSDFDEIIDANNAQAVNPDDGLLKETALSFWTDASQLPAPDADKAEVANRDGRSVARGGAGQKIPGFLAGDVGMTNAIGQRQVFVEPASGTSFDDFDADNTTAATLQSLLGAADTSSAEELIAWARGVDVDNEDGDASTSDARPWILGDVIHSAPLPINYGTTGGYSENNPNVRIFFGSNDGFFHILENTTSAGAESGKEVFSFIPRELLGNLQYLRSNAGTGSFPSSRSDHPYGIDGKPVALVVDHNGDTNLDSSDEVYVYFGMRRGGKSYYALDATNVAQTPKLLWKISKTSGGDFDELGYTFSTPKVAKVRYENAARDVLIFGGGYDLNKDGSAGSVARGPDAEGNAIYIVDARTGALIWKVVGGSGTSTNSVLYESMLTHSIPSEVSALDSNGNGVVDRLYVGDTGSVVWRVDLPEGSGTDHRKDNWSITKLANFWNSSGSQDRRFFHPPEIVMTKDGQGKYDGIVIASGDRANPTETRDTNYIFYIKDRNIQSGNPPPPASPPSAGVMDENSLADTTSCVTAACTLLDYSNGWKIELTDRGEKSLAAPLVVNGKIFITSYIPNRAGAGCAPAEGEGQLYIVNLSDGTASFNNYRNYPIGAGIPPAVTAIGQDTLIIPGSGIIDPFDPSNSSTNKSKVIQTGAKTSYILYWHTPGHDSI